MKTSMKQFLFIYAFLILLNACNSKKNEKLFFDENNTNRTKEILAYNNDLYIIGQHNFTQNNIEKTSSVLCIDTNFNKKWEIHLGDNKTNERFQNFAIDKLGNLYITGNISSLNTSVIIKANTTGQIIWRKEFENINSLNQIKLLNDSSLIIAGTKRLSETDLLNDSSFIQKIDTNGNTIWKTPICKDIGLRFLEIQNTKIIFCLNAGIFNGVYPNSKLFILNENGVIEKAMDLDFATTGIDLGVKVLKLQINESNEITILLNSYNNRNTNMQLVEYDMLGNYKRTIAFNPKNKVAESDLSDKLYLNTGLVVSGRGEKPATILLKQKINGEIYFTTEWETEKNFSFTGSILLKDKTYTIGDINNYEKFSAIWRISKSN
jgi:hypothetical protein